MKTRTMSDTTNKFRLRIYEMCGDQMQKTHSMRYIRFLAAVGWCAKHNSNSPRFWFDQLFSFLKEDENAAMSVFANSVAKYLYEPNVSVLKSGAYKLVGEMYNLKKLHKNSHLYTSDILINDFPGRIFEINETCGFNKKELKERLSQIKKANLSVRNFPLSVDELKKRLGVKDGGENYIFATTLSCNEKILLMCSKI